MDEEISPLMRLLSDPTFQEIGRVDAKADKLFAIVKAAIEILLQNQDRIVALEKTLSESKGRRHKRRS